MVKQKRFFSRVIALLIVLAVLVSSCNLIAFASSEQTQEEPPILLSDEDSTFVLANSNIQTGDKDYYPETANISEEHYAN